MMRRPAILWVLAAALLLRAAGLNWGLPQLYHQDEPIVVNHAMAIGVEGWNTRTYLPPQFSSYLLFLIYAAYFAIGSAAGLFSGAQSFALSFFHDPTPFYLLGRFFLGVVPGVLAVYALYRLAKRFFDPKTAFWSAALLAGNSMHVSHSHVIYMDIMLSLACILLLHSLLEYWERPCMANTLKLGAWFGLAVAVKYTAVYFFPVMLGTALIGGNRSLPAGRRLARLVLAGAVSVTVYALISPYSFLDWPNFISQVTHQSAARGAVGAWHHVSYSIAGATGIVFLFLTMLGMISLGDRQKARSLILVAALASYYAVNVAFSQPFARYMMPVLPFLCLFAGAGIASFTGDSRSPGTRAAVVIVACAELLVPTLYADALLMARDTRTECLEWFRENVPAGHVVVVDNRFFGPHLTQSAEQVRAKSADAAKGFSAARRKRLELELQALSDKTAYNTYVLSGESWGSEQFLFLKPSVRPDPEALRTVKADYLVLNTSDTKPEYRELARTLAGDAGPVAVFSPFKDPSRNEPTDRWASTGAPHLFMDTLSRSRPGPYLEVYRVKRS